jgi:hypothetical protein
MNQQYTDIIDDLRFLSEPRPLLWILASLCVLLAIVLVFLIRKRRKKSVGLNNEPSVAARVYIDALTELEKLRNQLSRERSREYAIQASDIVRRYIEQRFEINAPTLSTEEFFIYVQNSDKFDNSDRQALKEFLSACDFLKFARAWAEKDELINLHNLAVEFVKKTHNHKPEMKTPATHTVATHDANKNLPQTEKN